MKYDRAISEKNKLITKISDFIIGKQTSLLEEALSAGKKVVFYDNENHFKSMDYVLNQVDISEKNFDGLKKRITNRNTTKVNEF